MYLEKVEDIIINQTNRDKNINNALNKHLNRYIALLRGINISGKNRIPMIDLKKSFESLGFTSVKTYLNSGNVIFSTHETNVKELIKRIEDMMQKEFGLDIPIFVILQSDLLDILSHAPTWWGNDNKEIYDNLIFIMPPVSFKDVFDEIGEPKEELEQIENYRDAIFWSFKLKFYQKTNWWSKTINAQISNKLTIRTANTVRKISTM